MSEKIKVLHIIKSLGRGGAEMLLPETLRLHDQKRFEFHYIYFLLWKNQMVEAIERNGGVVKCLSASNNVLIILKTWGVIQYVRENKIQLIHCHLPWAGFVGRIVHLLTGIPVLYTEHNKQERYHWITRLLNRLTFNWQSKVIAVSADVAESIRGNIRFAIPVIEILNGVNTNTFVRDGKSAMALRTELNISPQGIVIGTVAVFRFQKRLKEWLDVFSKASESNNNLYGIIVGDGPLKNELFAYRKKLRLEHRVFMPGLQTEVRPWLSAMDIYMMTSVFEGLPIALLEAMSMECAVIATDAGGIKEVIRHEVSGLVVPVDQLQQLPIQLEKIVNDEAYRKSLGRAARNRVENNFDLTRMVKELEKFYLS